MTFTFNTTVEDRLEYYTFTYYIYQVLEGQVSDY